MHTSITRPKRRNIVVTHTTKERREIRLAEVTLNQLNQEKSMITSDEFTVGGVEPEESIDAF